MRHRKSFNHLGRTSSHRKAMLSNMAASLILHKRITTTVAKAKALRSYVEPLITRSKDDTTHSRRIAFSYLQNKEAVTELFREVAKKAADRPGGYTRIIKLGNRQGDNAEMAMMELVDFNELLLTEKSDKKAKTTRRRRGGKKKSTESASPATSVKEEAKPVTEKTDEVTPAEKVKEDVKEEAPKEPIDEVEAKNDSQSVAKQDNEPKAEDEKNKEEKQDDTTK